MGNSNFHSWHQLFRADILRFSLLSGGKEIGFLRGAFHPRTLPVLWMRVACGLYQVNYKRLGALFSLANLFFFRVEIPARAVIGPGFVLPHPQGVIVGSARIGANVTLFQNTTIGARNFDGAYDLSLRPVIEDDVVVGVGAVILGPVTVGKGATISANSLVLHDVPAGATAMGVPAQCRVKS
ncbi:serine O-acetyltransferase [Variovorax sp.]|jgi:serine O-acetyltransferase|uniref:serine O-acetyltransferase n=1 Tax=Variovorax sp. TaxID=1871043 RepID=UPI0037DA2FB9